MHFASMLGRSYKSVLAVVVLTALMIFASGASLAAQVRIQATGDVNVRTCPSTDCKVIGILPRGSCEIAHSWAGGRSWVEITFRGRRAFVSAGYVRRGCR